MPGCANDCSGREDCFALACCHTCGLFVREECVNDGSRGFLPRYAARYDVI